MGMTSLRGTLYRDGPRRNYTRIETAHYYIRRESSENYHRVMQNDFFLFFNGRLLLVILVQILK